MLDCPDLVCQNSLARNRPDLFPFHSTEVNDQSWLHRLRFIHLAQNIIQHYAETLSDLTSTSGIVLTDLFLDLALQIPFPDCSIEKPFWKAYERELFERVIASDSGPHIVADAALALSPGE